MSLSSDSISPSDHAKIARFIDGATGIQLPDHKRHLIETRLRKRQKVLGFDTLKHYVEFALSPKNDEQIMLIDAITTNKTEFFRENNHFVELSQAIKSNLAHFKKHGVKIWSSACSTGQEPYTLSIVMKELGLSNVKIYASDISVTALQMARKGVYPHADASPIPLSLRKKYLLKNPEKDLIKMSRTLKQSIEFFEFNLVTGDFGSLPQFDFIFCRNVMIYFNEETRLNIAANFAKILSPTGLLFIGHSESLRESKVLHQYRPTIYQLRGAK